MRPVSIILFLAIPFWLSGCGSGADGRMVGELAWDRVELTNEAAEQIRAIMVREGQQVASGDLLVQLDDRRAQAVLAGAIARVSETSRELERQQQLIKQHLASPEQVDRANSAWELAKADEQKARVALERLSISAPYAGRVDTLPFEIGETPPAGSVLAVLLVGEAPYARLYVAESMRNQVVVDSRVRVMVDGRDDPLQGRVRRIASDPAFTPFFALSEHERSHLSYLAEVTLEGAADLPAGLPVDAELVEGDE